MCRLFGLSGGPQRVPATFWLLNAPDSLTQQSHREPDGTGLGAFGADGTPYLAKQPVAAYADRTFAREARTVESRTFVAHIRYASTGANRAENTHPFLQDGRLFAHNGVIGGLDALETELGDARSLVHGDTDSERFFALITRHIRAGAGVGEAIALAAGWIAGHLPVYALNLVLITESELWALRYPDTHELYHLRRAPSEPLRHRGAPHEMRVQSDALADHPSVVVASEPMDGDPGWTQLRSGELLHVAPDLSLTVTTVLEGPPGHPLSLADLDPEAAASQQSTGTG
jgi:glutamine amidotransferase